VSLVAAAAALALAAASVLAEIGSVHGRAPALAGRGLAVASALLLVATGRPAAWPAAVLAVAAALVAPRSLPYLVAGAAAVVVALRPPSSSGPGITPLIAALALALAAAAFQRSAEERAAGRPGAPGAAMLGGAALVLSLALLDGGNVLRWQFGVGAGASRVELPGASLVLGVALLVTLAGTLGTSVHFLAAPAPTSQALSLGRRLLVLGAGLAGLGVAVTGAQVSQGGEGALAAGALDLAALALAAGLLVLGVLRMLADERPLARSESASTAGADTKPVLALAAAAALLAAATAGFEGWRGEGTYATDAVARAGTAALLGLGALPATRLGLARIALFTVALLALLAGAV